MNSNERLIELRQVAQAGLEEIGVPSQYAQPAAAILSDEIQRSEQGLAVDRSADDQRTVSDAYFWIEATEHDRRNGHRKS